MQELSQLAMNVERVFNEIQAMPLGKSVKKFDFEFTGDPSVDAVEEVAVLFKGRPTDAHLDCLASILEAFPDKVVEGSTCGERIGLRYTVNLRSQSAKVVFRWVGLRVIDRIKVGDYIYADRSISARLETGKQPLAVVYDIATNQVRIISTQMGKFAWGEGCVLPVRPHVDSFISFKKAWQLGDFFEHRQAWTVGYKAIPDGQLPAAAFVAHLQDALFQPGDWCLPTVDEGALVFSAALRPVLSRALARVGVSLNKGCWLMDEQSDSTAYKILYGQIHSSVVGASKNQVNPVLAVSALRWDELETFTIR